MRNFRGMIVGLSLVILASSTAAAQHNASEIVSKGRTSSVRRPVDRQAKFPDLRRTSASGQTNDKAKSEATTQVVSGSMVTVCSALAVVLGLFAGLVWVNRKLGGGNGNHGAIPSEVIQPLGSTPIDSRNRITMLRCGDRILVLAQNAQGVQPIAEITSPDEVRTLTAACLGDSKQAFASTLQAIEKEPTAAGFAESKSHASTPRSRGRLFASA